MKKKTTYELAEMTGLSQPHVWKVLNGKTNPTMETLLKIASAMGIKMSKLLDIIEKSKKEEK